MKIAIDCSHHLIPGGIRAYIERIVGAVTREDPTHEYTLYYRGFQTPQEVVPAGESAQVSVKRARVPRRWFSHLENRWGWPPIEYWLRDLDVFHGTHFTLPVSRRARLVLTVHDVAYLKSPEFYRDRELNEYGYRYLLPNSLKRADRILAISHSTKRDLIQLLEVPAEKIWVVPFGRDERFQHVSEERQRPVLSRYGLKGPFALFPVGTYEHRKNVERTLDAFRAAFPQPTERPALFITLVGEPSPEIREQVDRLGLCDHVRFAQVGYPDELMALMSAASWGLYPSLYEGFGLPPLEAMSCGLPMIVSDVSSVPEVVGSAARIVDPDSETDISQAMVELNADTNLRQHYREAGLERARQFTWDRAARQTLAAYADDSEAFQAEVQPLEKSTEPRKIEVVR